MHEIAPFMQRGFLCINDYVRIQATGQIKNKFKMEVIFYEKKNIGSIGCCRVIAMWM